MTGYYEIINTLKNQLIADEFVNTVTEGQIDDIDLRKQEIFPLSHIIVGNASRPDNSGILTFDVTVLCMDIVDINKAEETDIFLGNDNEQDVLNTQLAVGLRAIEVFSRGSNTANFEVQGDASFEPFTERFENNLAGWAVTFTIQIHNDMTSCDSVAGYNPCAPVSYVIKDGEGTTLYSGQVSSGGTLDQTIQDTTVTINTNEVTASVNAEGSKNFNLLDQNNDPVAVDSVSGDDVSLPVVQSVQYDIYVNGTFNQSVTLNPANNNTINITA